MPLIATRSLRMRQPQGVVAFGRGPIARGLLCVLIPGVGAVTRRGFRPFGVVPPSGLSVGRYGRYYPTGAGALAIDLGGTYGLPISMVSVGYGDFTGESCDVSFGGVPDNHLYLGYSSSSGAKLRARGTGIQDVAAGMPGDSTRNRWTVYGATFTSSTYRSVYVDGVFRNAGTDSVVTNGLYFAAIGDYWRGGWGNNTGVGTVGAAIWDRALSGAEHETLGRSPETLWAYLLAPIEHRIWVPSAGGTVPSITAVYADSVTASSVVPRVTLDFA